MPIFDYLCPKCTNKFDDLVRHSEDEVRCPKCDTLAGKQVSTPAFILKGEGFYSNGTFTRAKDGPVLDKELLRLSDRDLNVELGLPPDMD